MRLLERCRVAVGKRSRSSPTSIDTVQQECASVSKSKSIGTPPVNPSKNAVAPMSSASTGAIQTCDSVTNDKMKSKSATASRRYASKQLRRSLNSINSLQAIKFKLFIFSVVCLGVVEAAFYTFYFPNILKAKGFHELSEMIVTLEDSINATKDHFSDIQYFWGLMRNLDETNLENNYPEDSACKEVFPAFRELAIEYAYIDYKFYMSPMEIFLQNLIEFRQEHYPAMHESKAALPRQWEQQLLEYELQLKIEHLEKLASEQEYREKRQKLVEIWKNVRRSLDDSIECIYLKHAYRNIAEDINQFALDMNLLQIKAAREVLKRAYKRIAYFKGSDDKIIEQIREEIEKYERFIIRD